MMGKAKRKRLQVLRALQDRREETISIRDGMSVWDARAGRVKA